MHSNLCLQNFRKKCSLLGNLEHLEIYYIHSSKLLFSQPRFVQYLLLYWNFGRRLTTLQSKTLDNVSRVSLKAAGAFSLSLFLSLSLGFLPSFRPRLHAWSTFSGRRVRGFVSTFSPAPRSSSPPAASSAPWTCHAAAARPSLPALRRSWYTVLTFPPVFSFL